MIEKYSALFEKEMLQDFKKIIFSNFRDEEEQIYYHIQLPQILANTKSEKFEEICIKAYNNRSISGNFEEKKFYIYFGLAKRGKTKGIELLIKDLFNTDRKEFSELGYIAQTVNGRQILDKVIIKEIKKRKNYPTQQSLVKAYLKLPKNTMILKQIKKAKKELNSETLQLLNVEGLLK